MSTDTERKPLRLAKDDITCRVCGAECYWQEVWGKDGKPEIKLFEGGKPISAIIRQISIKSAISFIAAKSINTPATPSFYA